MISRKAHAPIQVGKKYTRWTIVEPGSDAPGRRKRWLCLCDCGQQRLVHASALKSGISTSCGCRKKELRAAAPRGEGAGNWKGGRIFRDGYIFLYAPDHPRANHKKYIGAHRLAMEAHIGRYLLPKETVHHINGHRDDNRIENLELWSKGHPAGQRVKDLLVWAQEIVKCYEHLKL